MVEFFCDQCDQEQLNQNSWILLWFTSRRR
jgi:hypothetical protein